MFCLIIYFRSCWKNQAVSFLHRFTDIVDTSVVPPEAETSIDPQIKQQGKLLRLLLQ